MLQSVSIEDVLMYSLKYHMPKGIKKCLEVLHKRNKSDLMSEICKLHLVISAAFTALQNLQIAPKTFDNDKCLVKCAYILRDLRFLFAHKPHISLEQFAAGILSLNKVIVIHFLCNGTKEELIENYMKENLSVDLNNVFSHLLNSPRFMKTYRQDVNKFKHFIATLLQNQEMKKNYLRSDRLVDFEETFWENLRENVHSYLTAVQSHLPPLKIEQVVKDDFMIFQSDLANRRSSLKKSRKQKLDEEDILNLLKHPKLAEDDSSNHDRKFNGNLSVATGGNTKNTCRPISTDAFYDKSKSNLASLKELSVVLTDIKSDARYFNQLCAEKPGLTAMKDPLKCSENTWFLMSNSKDVSMKDVAETTPETGKRKKNPQSRKRKRLINSTLLSNNDEKIYPSNRVATSDTGEKKNFCLEERLKPNSFHTARMSDEFHTATNSTKQQARRQLDYPNENDAFIPVDGIESTNFADDVPESDYSDDESVILSMDDGQLPDFTKFLYEKPNLHCCSVVLERLNANEEAF